MSDYSTASSPASPPIVQPRPDRSLWGGVVVITVLSLAWYTLPLFGGRTAYHDSTVLLLITAMAAIGLIPAAILAFWLVRARVIADADGLRWRSFGGWRTASWDAVTDYYDKMVVVNKRRVSKPFIVTERGTIRFVQDWTELPALQEIVQERATNARTHEWDQFGTRLEDDWPRTFDYAARGDRRFVIFLLALLAAMSVGMLCRVALRVQAYAAEMGPGWGIGFAVAGGLGALLPSSMALLFIPTFREARRRRNETMTVDTRGITLHRPTGDIEVRWEEVTDYFYGEVSGRSAGAGIVTYQLLLRDRIERIVFTSVLNDAALLRQIIGRYATSVVLPKDTEPGTWRHVGPETELLGGEATKWRHGREGVGERVFHYRTRTNRSLLFLGFFFLLMPLIPLGLALLGLEDRKGDPFAVIKVEAIFYLAMFWMLWRFAAGRIEVSEEGITEVAPFGRRTLRWGEITAYRWMGDGILQFARVTGAGGQQVGFWLGIADVKELRSLIAQRAPKPQKGWPQQEEEE